MSKQNHHKSPEEFEKDILNYKKRLNALEKQLEQVQAEKDHYAKKIDKAESSDRYELLFKSTGLGVIHRNRLGEIIYANPAASNILGVPNEKLLNIERFEPPVKNIFQDGTEMTADMHPAKKVFKTGKEIPNTVIGVYNSIKQVHIWINLTAIPLVDHSGNVEMVYTVFEDITKRLETDNLLENSIARSKALLKTIPDHILRIDKEGKLLDFHGVNQEIFFREKVTVGMKIEDLFDLEFYQLFIEKQKQIKKTGALLVFEYQFTSTKNEKHFSEVRMSRNELGEITSIIRDVSKSKKSEQKIEEAKRQLSTLMGNLNGMAYRCLADKDWTMLFVSDGVFDLTGYEVDEILNNSLRSYGSMIINEDRKLVEDVVSKASETNERFSVEYRILTKKGKIKWVFEQGITIKDSSGKTLFIEGYISDVTDRKLAQQSIESSESKFRLLFNSMSEAVFVHPWKESAFQTFVEVNDMAIQRYGYTRDEFLKLSPPDMTRKGELNDDELVRIRESLKNFGRVRFETRHITKKGELFPVVINANVIELNGKQFIQSIVRDVSEQKIADEKLDHKSQIEKLISSISAEFVSFNMFEFDKVINTTLQRISQLICADRSYVFLIDENNQKAVNTHEWCGENVSSLLGGQREIPKDQLNWWIDKFENHEQIYISSMAELPEEAFPSVDLGIQIEEKSGLYLPLFYQENLLGFLGFDVLEGGADLNKSDFYLLYTFADLLAGVFYRRNFEEKLILAKEKAEESDRLKSIFLASMSHELRTPLNAIIGFSGLGVDNTKKESYEKWNKIINSSGKYLLNIIESIFDVSLLQAKEAKLEESEFSLSEFFATLQQYLKAQLKKHNKTKLGAQMFSFANSEVVIKADKTKLMQLITNFLNNAIKYTEQGQIEYGYRVVDNDVLFSVSDSGIGIKEEDRKVIFDVFRQLEDPLVSNQSGVGLGLAICKEIAELMKGELCLESEEGKGSTFYFKLFNVVVDRQEPVKKTELKPPKLNGKTILVVEDVEYNYLLISEMLTPTAARVIWAKDGKESIRLINSESSIELVLMDIKMPLMDGYEASRKILSAKPNLPIIAQTAYALKSDRKRIIEAGFKDYIPKPIDEELLYRLLNLYLPSNTA